MWDVRNMLKFVRSYYLYIFYWFAEINKSKSGAPSKFIGFMMISLFAIPIKLMSIMMMFWPFFETPFSEIIEWLNNLTFFSYYKGDVTGLSILFWIAGILVGYLICFKNIRFEQIPERLAAHHFLSTFSQVKLVLMLALPVFLFLTLGFLGLGLS